MFLPRLLEVNGERRAYSAVLQSVSACVGEHEAVLAAKQTSHMVVFIKGINNCIALHHFIICFDVLQEPLPLRYP